MRRSGFRVKLPGRLTHTPPVTEQVASLMCDEEYGPTQAPLWDMLRDGTVTSSREDVGPKEGPHLPAWAGEHLTHCVPPRHAPHVPMDIAARSGTLCCLAVLGADAAVAAPHARQGEGTTPGRTRAAWQDGEREAEATPPAGGEQAREASLRLEFLPLARRSPFPHRHRGEG